jgi:CRISPR-associated protein Csx3
MAGSRVLPLSGQSGFGLVRLTNASSLCFELLPSGAVYALRHGSTLLNQLLPGPAEDGLFRLLLRDLAADGTPLGHLSLVGSGLAFSAAGTGAVWQASAPGLDCTTRLQLHQTDSAWQWTVSVRNTGSAPRRIDVLLAQDLGLADEGAVRNNEAYTSHYIDLLPVMDAGLGWTVLARQNQAMAGGRFPWLAHGCLQGASAFCTDGWQFFGADHRLTGRPAAVAVPALPSSRLQYEFALCGLQSRAQELAPGASVELRFVAVYLPDHRTASSASDLGLLHAASVGFVAAETPAVAPASPRSLFLRASWLHGDELPREALAGLFPGPWRHVETDAAGSLLSFFSGESVHVVTRRKEAALPRPHGHILRSGAWDWIDDRHFGVTCYAPGLFGTQAHLGHPNFARVTSVMRNALNVMRASGQRVFVRGASGWSQLGVPSAFVIEPGRVRWYYQAAGRLIEATVVCAAAESASLLSLRIVNGPDAEFLVTHELVLGANDYELDGLAELHPAEGWALLRPSRQSLIGQHQEKTCFGVAAKDPFTLAGLDTDGLLYEDGRQRGAPYLCLQSRSGRSFGVLLFGTLDGADTLPAVLSAARSSLRADAGYSLPPAAPLVLSGPGEPGVSRINEILPWFAHNAAIHFSSPHGLEQYGGSAWGVRDVCQGAVEWLLVSGRPAPVRRILEAVFGQQYEADGTWPQWFMFPPYRFIQQAHSHGDVCFWPLKALCDYVEYSGDTGFVYQTIGYTDRSRFVPAGPAETVLGHCRRILAHWESRCVPGTALVNYGDGDWDDTLQPADPVMRTRMVSAWTVGLAFHSFRQFRELCHRLGEQELTARLDGILGRMRHDFAERLMPDGIVAGFLINNEDGSARPLLHPSDTVTGIRHRLLPMTRSVLAELFTPAEAERHMRLVQERLLYPDGVRLMSEPCAYQGGLERLFKRAETAANVGREIGLQYVHAHLRYAEALAKLGHADALWTALQTVNPVALKELVPHAAERQANVYFSSSDADFPDRLLAVQHWEDLRTGKVAVRAGWRLYSSGPGLFLHKVRACLLGLREFYDDVIFDPVLPKSFDGLSVTTRLCDHPVRISYRVGNRSHTPSALIVNGQPCPVDRLEPNPYRQGGCLVSRTQLLLLLKPSDNEILVQL